MIQVQYQEEVVVTAMIGAEDDICIDDVCVSSTKGPGEVCSTSDECGTAGCHASQSWDDGDEKYVCCHDASYYVGWGWQCDHV